MTLVSLLDMIGRELGIRGAQRPCLRSLDDLPPSLQEFYAQYDGLTLPFLELCPAE